METLTITQTLNDSIRFERQFRLLAKATMQLEKAKHYYRMRERKLQELDSREVLFPGLKPKLEKQIRKATVYYDFMYSRYRKTIGELAHNKGY